MSHWIIAPLVIPLVTATVIVLAGERRIRMQRVAGAMGLACLAGAVAVLLSDASQGEPTAYALGNWPAPFGIVLVIDRLAALMLALATGVAIACYTAALDGWDTRGCHFHALLQLQMFGLNGAFLTGDLFNLFVFFEVLLIASYGMLLHGGGGRRAAAAFHFVTFNLGASTLFLFAVSLLYGVTGTLNMADLALRVASTPPEDIALVHAGGLLLFVVFAVKAALLPINLWLQATYRAASPPVVVLFAVMTKVGVYAIVRIHTLVFGATLGSGGGLLDAALAPIALATLVFATIGALGSRDLVTLATWLVVASVGTMLTAASTWTADGVAAALFYMTHSTVALALLLLIAHRIAAARGAAGATLVVAPAVGLTTTERLTFVLAAAAAVGFPPLAGFVAKLTVLQSALGSVWVVWVWAVVLVTSLAALVALARGGSILFWKSEQHSSGAGVGRGGAWTRTALAFLALAVLALIPGAPLLHRYTDAAAAEVTTPANYVRRVLFPGGGGPIIDPERRRALDTREPSG